MDRSGFLALSASDFQTARGIGPGLEESLNWEKPSPYAMTNSGLHLQLPLLDAWTSHFAVLDAETTCHDGFGRPERRRLGIHIRGDKSTGRMYRRRFPSHPFPLAPYKLPAARKELFISESQLDTPTPMELMFNLDVRFNMHTDRDDEGMPILLEESGEGDIGEVFAFLTFEPRERFRALTSIPDGRFDPRHSIIMMNMTASNYYISALEVSYILVDDSVDGRTWCCEAVLLSLLTVDDEEFLVMVGASVGAKFGDNPPVYKMHQHRVSHDEFKQHLEASDGRLYDSGRLRPIEGERALRQYIMPIVQRWLQEARAEFSPDDWWMQHDMELKPDNRWDPASRQLGPIF